MYTGSPPPKYIYILIITLSVCTVFGDTQYFIFVSFFGLFPSPLNFFLLPITSAYDFFFFFFNDNLWQEGAGIEESPEEGTVLPQVSGLHLCTGARPAPSPPSGCSSPPGSDLGQYMLTLRPARSQLDPCRQPEISAFFPTS